MFTESDHHQAASRGRRWFRLSGRHEDLIEERIVPSGELLGGKLLSSSEAGIVREVKVAFCGTCHKHLKLEEICLCDCGRKLCDTCMKEYDGRKLCLFCLQAELPIRKTDLMILEAIHAGIQSKNRIALLARITLAETTAILQRMRDQGYLSCRGVSIFATPILTNKALAAMRIYFNIYQDADLSQFRNSISEMSVHEE